MIGKGSGRDLDYKRLAIDRFCLMLEQEIHSERFFFFILIGEECRIGFWNRGYESPHGRKKRKALPPCTSVKSEKKDRPRGGGIGTVHNRAEARHGILRSRRGSVEAYTTMLLHCPLEKMVG